METRGLRRGKWPLAPWVLTPVSPARGPRPVTFQMEVSWGSSGEPMSTGLGKFRIGCTVRSAETLDFLNTVCGFGHPPGRETFFPNTKR